MMCNSRYEIRIWVFRKFSNQKGNYKILGWNKNIITQIYVFGNQYYHCIFDIYVLDCHCHFMPIEKHNSRALIGINEFSKSLSEEVKEHWKT